MGRLDGQVALITGAARGQGRSHAVRLAEEGADIVAIDICDKIDSVLHPMAAPEDLEETVRLVEKCGRRIIARQADVRSYTRLKEVVDEALAEFGHIDTLVANAGIAIFGKAWEMSEDQWQDVIDVNLTGVWHTVKAVIPSMIDQGSGSIIVIGSGGSIRGFPNCIAYTAAKHGVLGIARGLALELAQYTIRVNAVLPYFVNTPMVQNKAMYELFYPDRDDVTIEDFAAITSQGNALPIPWVEPVDISNAVLWLASDEARYVTGTSISVDAGHQQK